MGRQFSDLTGNSMVAMATWLLAEAVKSPVAKAKPQ